MRSPSFSVIIATCNRPDRLLQALTTTVAAIRAQGGAGGEIVVADNGRVRPAAEAVGQMPAGVGVPVRVLLSEPNNKAAALNAGIEAARNPWLAFTDDDCLPEPDWLIGAAAFIARFPGVRVFSGQLRAGPVDFPLPRWLPPGSGLGLPWSPAFVDFAPLPESGILPDGDRVPFGANIVVHRDVFKTYGGYDEALWHRCGRAALGCEDAEFAMRVRRAGESIGYCREALVVHPVISERATLKYYLRHIYHAGVREPHFTDPAERPSRLYLLRTMTGSAVRCARAWVLRRPVEAMRHGMEAVRDVGEMVGWRQLGRRTS